MRPRAHRDTGGQGVPRLNQTARHRWRTQETVINAASQSRRHLSSFQGWTGFGQLAKRRFKNILAEEMAWARAGIWIPDWNAWGTYVVWCYRVWGGKEGIFPRQSWRINGDQITTGLGLKLFLQAYVTQATPKPPCNMTVPSHLEAQEKKKQGERILPGLGVERWYRG